MLLRIRVAGLKTYGEDLFRVNRREVDGAVAEVDLALRIADGECSIARSAVVWAENVSARTMERNAARRLTTGVGRSDGHVVFLDRGPHVGEVDAT